MPSLVHLGLGNFHRAHQAWYTHHANAQSVERWRITGVAMRNAALRDAMAPADWAYDLGILSPEGLRVERVNVHDRVLVAAEAPERVVAALAEPGVSAVTLTVTEKGYGLTASGSLNVQDPGIAADIAGGTPQTVMGMLAAGLTRRVALGGGALTVLSCDNLGGNGTLLRHAMSEFLNASGASPGVLETVRFPNTMVDRITPATTNTIADQIAAVAGRPVIAPVLTEAFSEWVIEDTGPANLPDWTRAGAVFVPDVGPYERRKLLVLNAAHSALAYGGLLRGHTYVHEAVADETLIDLIRALWAEAAPLLQEFGTAEREAYTGALLSRFSVAGMAHRLSQIAMDGSVKLPQRILPILRHHRYASPAAARVLGDWWRLMAQRARAGAPFDDPMAEDIARMLGSGGREKDGLLPALYALGVTVDDLPNGFADICLPAPPGP
jgi:fructuronate reductase